MANPIKRGNSTPQEQRRRYQFDFNSGSRITREYSGISQAKMTDLYNLTAPTCLSAEMSFEKDIATATFVIGGDPAGQNPGSLGITVDRWEMPGDDEDADLFFHPELYYLMLVLGTFSSFGVINTALVISYLAAMRKGVEDKTLSEDLFTNDNFDGWDALGASGDDGKAVQNEIIRFYELYLNGQTHYKKAKYSLRHTTNTPNYWTRNVSDTNVNKILTTAQLLSEVQDGSLWNFPLPGRLSYKINALNTAFQSVTQVRDNFLIGWLKLPSSETSVGRSRTEIQTVYIYDQWSTDVYIPA